MESTQTVLTAAHCAKTIILASSHGSVILRQCTKRLIPVSIEFMAQIMEVSSDRLVPESASSAFGEIWKAFLGLFNSVGTSKRMFPFLSSAVLI